MMDLERLGKACQELQDARAENKRLQWDFDEAMRQYNAQQKRACDAEAENKRLRSWLGRILSTADTFGADSVDSMGLIAGMASEALKGESDAD